MSEYKNVLIGKNTFFLDWKSALNKLHKPNVVVCDFNCWEKVKEILIHKNISYIIPLSHKDNQWIQSALAKSIDTNIINIKILYPTEETMELLNNKNKFTEFMLTHFATYIPDIYYLNNVKLKDIIYPAICKPMYSTNGSNVAIIHSHEEFTNALNTSANNTQQFIPYEYEYGAYMLCIDGMIVTQKIIRMKYKKNHIKTSNFPRNYETVQIQNITFVTDVFQRIIYKLHYSGGLCIDFKVDEDANRVYIFEINPRFGGSAFSNHFIYELLCIP